MSRRSLDEVVALVARRRRLDVARSGGRAVPTPRAPTRRGEQIVEIGSFRGRSTIVLAGAAPDDGVKVVAIDPHAGNDRGPQEIDGFAAEAADDHESFTANLAAAGVADRVRHVREFSDARRRRVAARSTCCSSTGRTATRPRGPTSATGAARVAAGGAMLIHDSFSSVGVTLAIGRELLFGRGSATSAGRVRSPSTTPTSNRVGDRAIAQRRLCQLAQLPWFAKNVAIKVLLTLHLGRCARTAHRPSAGVAVLMERCDDCGFVYDLELASTAADEIVDLAGRMASIIRDREPFGCEAARGPADVVGARVRMSRTRRAVGATSNT